MKKKSSLSFLLAYYNIYYYVTKIFLVRIYDEAGVIVVQKCFHGSPVKNFKFQSIPEGKQSTNILFTQAMQGNHLFTFGFKYFLQSLIQSTGGGGPVDCK